MTMANSDDAMEVAEEAATEVRTMEVVEDEVDTRRGATLSTPHTPVPFSPTASTVAP